MYGEEAFLSAFEDCSLPDSAFHHRDHVRLAWIYLRDLPLLDALGRFTTGLRRYAAAGGKPDRYHETITFAFLFLVHERMQRSPGARWEEFERRNNDLLGWNPSILSTYYRPETLASEHARVVFVLPDRPVSD
jgi:hypothetical protein